MKKFLYLTLLSGLSYGSGFAQVARNAASQLPPNFQADRQADYNNITNPDVTFQQYYNIQQARYYHEDALLLDPSLRYRPGPSRPSMCGNGDFDAGLDPNEWQGGYGYVDGSGNVLYGSFAAGLTSGLIGDFNAHQTLTDVGSDPYVPINTTAPTGSVHAVRLGNAAAQNGSELLSKTFVVPADKSIVSFWYALVLENPNDHIPIAQPAFRVRVLDVNGNVIPGLVNLGNGSDVAISDASNPFFMSANGPSGTIAYRDWSCASINLSGLIGQQVTVQFVTNDCAMGAHFGYAYIDDFCGSCSSNPYNMSLASTRCGEKSQVCIDYQLPAQGSLTGSVNIDLNLYQNGNLLMTLHSGQLSSGSNYCFDFSTASIPGMNPALGGFDYTAVGNFTIGSTALSPFYLFAPPDGAIPGQNNDCSFSLQCCPGKNLIDNGDFEAGNTGFTSDFLYQPNIAANSVWMSQYNVLTDAEAQTVASTWNPECPATGKHLIVNGATGQTSGGYRKAWEQTIEVKPGTYKFCGDFKALQACAFNVRGPRILISTLSGLEFSNVRVTIQPTSGPCNWKRVEQTLTVPPNASTITITIGLTETLEGDGNDLAMDNFSLVRMDSVPENEVTFGLVPSNFSGWNYNLTATPDLALPSGCNHYWEVAEVDPNNNYAIVPGTQVVNPTSWTTQSPNTFIGYNGSSSISGTAPGLFDMRKTYRIAYGRTCSCLSLTRRYVLYGPVLSRNAAQRDDVHPQVIGSGVLDDAAQQPAASTEQAAGISLAPIRIFPNPTNGSVTVQKTAAGADYVVKVSNSLGQVVKTVTIKKNDLEAEFSLAGVSPGNYIVHVVAPDGTIIHSEKIAKL